VKIVEVRSRGGHVLFLRFSDGTRGELDLGKVLRFQGLLKPLRDVATFSRVKLDREFGTIGWPNGAELDTYVLYSRVTGAPLPGGETLPPTRKRLAAATKRKRAIESPTRRKSDAHRAHAS
jgi:hypothetical protein